jgi:hypothetical protein
MSIAQLVFAFPHDVTFEEASAAIALHFGGQPINLSTGEATDVDFRDAAAVFTGTSQMSASTGASAATAQPTTETDAEGLPWDERIHSSSKAKNDNGNWKLKKGVANSKVLEQVRAELMSKRTGGGVPTSQVSMTNDSDAAQQARLTFAADQATVAAGPRTLLTDEQFDKLKKGQMVDVLQGGLDWFNTWRAAFDKAYGEYAAQAQMPAATATQVQQQPVTTQTAQPAAPANDFASFSVWYGTTIAVDPAKLTTFNEVCSMFNLAGFGGLAANQAMIPAVKSLLETKGIV